MRDRARVSMAASAFFFCFVLLFPFLQRNLCRYKIYWEFDCIRQIIYFTCREWNWWCFVTVNNGPRIVISLVDLNNNFPSAKENKPVWCLVTSYLLFFFYRIATLNSNLFNENILGNKSKTRITSGLCVFPQARSLLQPGGAPACRSVGFCLLLTHFWGKKSMQIISSEILAFSPSLKGCGVPQGWCLILAPFVSSIQV